MASDQDSPSAVSELYVCGYRSIRNLRLKLDRVNVLVGPNGCGKTNLYQSMVLLSAAAQGQLARALAEEGGMPSVLWAGPRKKGPVRLVLGFSTGDFHYELQCGLSVPGMSMFNLDPEVKEEHIWFTCRGKKAALLERDHGSVRARNAEGVFEAYPMALSNSESVLSQLREPHRFPELSMLRQEILSWRFYHHFRTDREAPLRQPQVGVRTTVLSHDGRDLAAALQTIVEIGDRVGLDEAIGKAFPGSSVEVVALENRFSVLMQMPGVQRPFEARELSDGTLRYLCLLAALMSPRPPDLLALNEPETSLHPNLFEPLAALIGRAARDSQVWITTHSQALAGYLARDLAITPTQLCNIDGETWIGAQPV